MRTYISDGQGGLVDVTPHQDSVEPSCDDDPVCAECGQRRSSWQHDPLTGDCDENCLDEHHTYTPKPVDQ